jgi:hypothetical protein
MTNNINDYPTADEKLREKLSPDEAHLAILMAQEIEKGIKKQYQNGNARRDVHTKATGIVKAEFRINETLPEHLAKGVFVPGKVYHSIIRFSNGNGDPNRADNNDDGRGMAIKLLNVEGEKILGNGKNDTTQDFVMINHPVFLSNDPHKYLSLIQKSSGNLLSKLSIPFTIGLKATLVAKEINSGKISNPLQIRYFSATPYQLGIGDDRQAIKFSAKPVSDIIDEIPKHPSQNYLTEAMVATLQNQAIEFKFLIQPRANDSLSVEDSMVEWKETDAPFYEVATIHIPKQEFNTEELNKLGERLSFNPWHSLPEHRPLGSLNRIRKVVYEQISRVRNEMNGTERTEPK